MGYKKLMEKKPRASFYDQDIGHLGRVYMCMAFAPTSPIVTVKQSEIIHPPPGWASLEHF